MSEHLEQSRRAFLLSVGLGAAASAIPLPWWTKLFQPRGRSMIAVPPNYGEILPYGVTSREDLIDVIQVLSPFDSPLFELLRQNQHNRVQFEWVTEELETIVAAKNVVRFLPRPKYA